nr:hypothetical protein [uncultured Rhodopila sp.]
MTTTTTAAQVAAAYTAILRTAPPAAYAASVAAQIDQGNITFSDFENSLIGGTQALATTLATLVTIDVFYNATPKSDLLTTASTASSATGYFTAQQLANDGYSAVNAWTILGANWASDPNSNFAKLYGGYAISGSAPNYAQFVNDAYLRVFGSAPAASVAQWLSSSTEIANLTALLSGGSHTPSALQVMGGIMGYLLYVGQSNNLGTYASAADSFLTTAANDEAALAGSSSALYGPELTKEFPGPAIVQIPVLTVTPSISGGAATATEGSTVTFNITEQNIAAGTVLNYTLSGVTAAEVLSGSLSGQVTVAGDGTANIGVTLLNDPGENLTGTLTATVTGPSGSTANASVSLSETPAVVDAATIAAANGATLGGTADVVVTPASGSDTVTVQGTGGLIANNGIVIQGNANVTVKDVDGGIGNAGTSGQIVTLAGSGNNTVILSVGVTDGVTGGTGSTNIEVADGFKSGSSLNYNWGYFGTNNSGIFEPQTLNGGTGTSNTLTVLGKADFTAGNIKNLQTIALTSGATATFTTLELYNDLKQPTVAPTHRVEPSISVAAGGTGSLVINDASTSPGAVDLTDDLSGVTSLTVENGATVILGTADVAALTQVSTAQTVNGSSVGTIITTVAGAKALLALDPALQYGLQDTPANLLAAPASLLANATSVANPNGTVTLTEAVAIYDATLKGGNLATYQVGDTPADIVAALVYNDEYSALLENPNATVSYTAQATVAQAEILGKLAGNYTGFAVTDTAANIGNALADPGILGIINSNILGGSTTPYGLASITISGGTVTATEANAIAAFKSGEANYVTVSGSFAIVDSIGAIAGLIPAAVKLATSVSIASGEGAGNVTAIQNAEKVVTAGGKTLAGSYSLIDTAAHLKTAPVAIVKGASQITVTDGVINAKDAAQIVATAATTATVTFNTLTDTVAALIAVPVAVLKDASSVVVSSGTATVKQALILAPYVAAQTVALADGDAALAAASSALLKSVASITVTGTVTFAQALAAYTELHTLGLTATYAISDTAADILAVVKATGYAGSVNQTVLNGATKLTVTDATVTVAQADQLHAIGVTAYNISDTAAHVAAAAADPAVTSAATVTATGTSTVNQAETLSVLANLTGGYTLADTPQNIANAPAALVNDAAAPATFTGASPTVVVGSTPTVTVAEAQQLLTLSSTAWSGTYTLADTIANLKAATPQELAAAAGNVYAADNIADLNADLAATPTDLVWVKNNTKGLVVTDVSANLSLPVNTDIVSSAVEVVVTDPVNVATSEALYKINPALNFTLAITPADLTGSALIKDASIIKVATTISASGITVANAETLLGLNPNTKFTLSDTAANLAAAGAASAVSEATGVTVSNAATVAQAAAIAALDPTAVYSIADTAADLSAPAAAATLEGATGITVTDGTRVTLSAAEVFYFGTGLAGWQSTAPGAAGPVSYNLTDTAANLEAAWAVIVQNAGNLTAIAGGQPVTASRVATLEALNGSTLGGSYALSDTYAALTNPAWAAIVKGAASVTDTDPISVSSASTLLKLYAGASFSLNDTAADLTAAAAASVVKAATSVFISNPATVAAVQAVEALNSGTVGYSLSDTAADLAAAPAALLAGAAFINFTTAATVAQITAVDAAVAGDVPAAIVDNAANIAAASQAVLNAAATTVQGTATAAQAAIFEKLDLGGAHITYKVSDTAANIAAADVSFTHATKVTLTGTPATAAQADILSGLTYNGGLAIAYSVADTAANLLNPANAGWSGSGVTTATVTDTGGVNVATAEQIAAANTTLFNNGGLIYTISDTQDRIVEALSPTGTAPGALNLNQILGQAQSVSIGGTTTVLLTDVGGTYVVQGSVSALQALDPSVLSAAGYVVKDTVANEQAAAALVQGGYDHDYVIADTATNIVAAAQSFLENAHEVVITDAATTYASVEAVNKANPQGLGDVTFSLTDTAADLFSGVNPNPDVTSATTITVTTALTGTQAVTLLAEHPANASTGVSNTYSISDTAAGLFGGGNTVLGNDVAAVKAASSVKITTLLTDAQAQSLLADNTSATYTLADTVGDLFSFVNGVWALEPVATAGATTVSVNDATLNVAQATLLTALGSKFIGGYKLSDTSAKLAGASGAVLQGAGAITQTDVATVAQASSILNSLGSSSKLLSSLSVTDTVANIIAAGQAVLTDVTTLSVASGSIATAAQAEQLQALTYDGSKAKPVVYTVSDTSANILTSGYAAGITAAASVTATDAISISTAKQIWDLNGSVNDQFSLKDVAINFGSSAVVTDATTIEVTDPVTVSQANLLQSDFAAGASYIFDTVTDTVANLSAANAKSLLGHASAIDVSDTAANETVASIKGLENTFGAKLVLSTVTLSDTVQGVLGAYDDTNYSSTVADAKSVLVSGGTATVAEAQILENLSNLSSKSSFGVNDTLQFISKASAALLNSTGVSGITATANSNNGGVAQQFNDTGVTNAVTVQFTAGAGGAETISLAGNTFTLAGVDLLSLNSADTLDLHGYGVALPVAATSVAGQPTIGNAVEITGNVTNGGANFTAAAGGSATLLLWNSAAYGEAGVIVGSSNFHNYSVA